MGYLTNSGSGFLSNAVTTVSNVKSYLINKTGYLVDAIRIGINDFGQRVLDDGGTVEASAEAAASYREITKDIYDQASLVLFPSGYKDNLLYSHKPTNGSGDFTYTRGTDTATRVGADGYIKKERANLLVQSNQFDTTWVINTSVSEGEEGYDGTTDAWSLTRAATGSLMGKQTVSLSGVSTYSIYAKINTNNGIGLALGGLSIAARFDLRDATKTQAVTETGIISSSQKYVGNGFYRLSITANISGSTEARIYLTTADATTSDSNGGTHIIQDAQVEQGLVATPYIETTTAPVYEGLTDNLPRIDYTGGTPSILLEPSRTNLSIQSEYITGSGAPLAIQSAGMTISYNQTTSSEGVDNAMKWTEASNNGLHWGGLVLTGTSVGDDLTISIFAKRGTSDDRDIIINIYDGATSDRARYNLDAGTIVTDSAASNQPVVSMEDYGNGWWRCIYTRNLANSGYNAVVGLVNGTAPSWQGNGTSNIYTYGLQYEVGSYATSYIPTYGSIATRAADGEIYKDLAANNFIGNTFSIFFEIDNVNYGTANSNFNYLNSSIGGSAMYVYGSTLGIHTTTGDDYSTFLQGFTNPKGGKFLAVYNGSDVKIYKDGGLYRTISNPSARWDNVTIYRLRMFSATATNNYKSLMIFPTALTDDDCKALTAL